MRVLYDDARDVVILQTPVVGIESQGSACRYRFLCFVRATWVVVYPQLVHFSRFFGGRRRECLEIREAPKLPENLSLYQNLWSLILKHTLPCCQRGLSFTCADANGFVCPTKHFRERSQGHQAKVKNQTIWKAHIRTIRAITWPGSFGLLVWSHGPCWVRSFVLASSISSRWVEAINTGDFHWANLQKR